MRFAIADPAVAPYGVAAREVLRAALGEGWDQNLVKGESVGQAFTFVATGNVDAGLVALSQPKTYEGEIWVLEIDARDHTPILQDAALLTQGADKAAAQTFYEFLSTDFVRFILQDAGYVIPTEARE
jgi:molybdate transport system substrate-binding protein